MFKNKTAIVTGAGSGIGRSVALLLAEGSAKMILVDKNPDGLTATKNLIESMQSYGESIDNCITLCADITDSGSVNDLFSRAKQFSDDISMLANCAGIRMDAYIVNMTENLYDQVMNVSAKGSFLMSKQFCELVKTRMVKDAAIVNITSISPEVGNPIQVNYNMSKAYIEDLTFAIAAEMGPFGLRCNAIRPGFVDTPLIYDVKRVFIDGFIQATALKRMGQPEEVAQTIVYLLSPKSSFTTGTIVPVAGGCFL